MSNSENEFFSGDNIQTEIQQTINPQIGEKKSRKKRQAKPHSDGGPNLPVPISENNSEKDNSVSPMLKLFLENETEEDDNSHNDYLSKNIEVEDGTLQNDRSSKSMSEDSGSSRNGQLSNNTIEEDDNFENGQPPKKTTEESGSSEFDKLSGNSDNKLASIWINIFDRMKDNPKSFYANERDDYEHHKSYGPEGFTTCCPNCAHVHVRGKCMYDLTDVIIYYLANDPRKNKINEEENQHYKLIYEAFIDYSVGGIVFPESSLNPDGSGGVKTLKIQGIDAIEALCMAVLTMDALSDNPVYFDETSEKSASKLKEAFERARNWSVLQYFPSVRAISSQLVKTNIDAETFKNKVEKTKESQMSEIEKFIEALYLCKDEVICNVTITGENGKYLVTDSRAQRRNVDDLILLRCPKCGKPVARTAGLYDEIIVGMLGLVDAGKTSIIMAIDYLVSNQIGNISLSDGINGEGVDRSDLSLKMEFDQDDVGSGPLRQDRDAFAKKMSIKKTSTQELFHSTICVTLCKGQEEIKHVNVMLIDIAGETTKGVRAHPLYYKADCFWFCLLPNQNGIDDGSPKIKNNITETFHQRKEFYDSIFNNRNQSPEEASDGEGTSERRKKIPIAIIYTRSDCYLKNFGNQPEIQYICPVDPVDSVDEHIRYDDITRYLGTFDGKHVVNVGEMRDLSMNILRFMANIRLRHNDGLFEEFADIEKGSGSNPVGRNGEPCVDILTYFAPRSRYSVFACSPYGGAPIDRTEKDMDAKLKAIQNKLQDYQEERNRSEEDVRINRKKLDMISKVRRVFEGLVNEWKQAVNAIESKKADVSKAHRDYIKQKKAVDKVTKELEELRSEGATEDVLRDTEEDLRDLMKTLDTLQSAWKKFERALKRATDEELQAREVVSRVAQAINSTITANNMIISNENLQNMLNIIKNDFTDDFGYYVGIEAEEEKVEKKWVCTKERLAEAGKKLEKARSVLARTERDYGGNDSNLNDVRSEMERAQEAFNAAQQEVDIISEQLNTVRQNRNEGYTTEYRTLLERMDAAIIDVLRDLTVSQKQFNVAVENYQKAVACESDVKAAHARADKQLKADQKNGSKADPFGVLLPLIWTLSLGDSSRRLLIPVTMYSGEIVEVDDDWLAINKKGFIPEEPEITETTKQKLKGAVQSLGRSILSIFVHRNTSFDDDE